MKFRKKPATVDAWRIDHDNDDTNSIPIWVIEALRDRRICGLPTGGININTLEGVMHGKPGDWLVKGHLKGELWAVDREIFEASYEPA